MNIHKTTYIMYHKCIITKINSDSWARALTLTSSLAAVHISNSCLKYRSGIMSYAPTLYPSQPISLSVNQGAIKAHSIWARRVPPAPLEQSECCGETYLTREWEEEAHTRGHLVREWGNRLALPCAAYLACWCMENGASLIT